jgi:hypothetical protein
VKRVILAEFIQISDTSASSRLYVGKLCLYNARNSLVYILVAAFYLFSYFSSSPLTVMSRLSVPLTIDSSLGRKGKQIVRDPP